MKFLPLPREKRRLLDPLGRTALTCLLTAGSFGGLCAPLPLALTAAAGPGLPGLCCVLGCGAGAFLFLPFQAGLRQLAAAILIFSGSIAFYDTRLFARRTLRLWRCCPCPAPPCPGSVPPLSRCASGHSAPWARAAFCFWEWRSRCIA
ncbi:MAG: hypothetical protein ACLUYM_04705 [Oscillospiraceae bacterium]